MRWTVQQQKIADSDKAKNVFYCSAKNVVFKKIETDFCCKPSKAEIAE
jgi:hypothetical protein